ncbi:MAG: hypothetical protein ABL886_17185, partial [Rhodoglobus sp.]
LVAPVEPTVTVISECDMYGSVTLPETDGVDYVLTVGDGVEGPWQVTATPAAGYHFDGDQVVTYSGDLGEYTDCVEPTPASFTDSVCEQGLVTSGFFTIPATEGVMYTVSINGGGFTEYSDGDYEVADGDVVEVKANAEPGNTLTGDDYWSHEFADVGECELPTLGLATPSYSSTPITCNAPGSYTVGAAINGEHVIWTLEGDDTVIPFGTYPVVVGQTISLVASSDDPPNYGLVDSDSNEWINPVVLTFVTPSAGTCGDLVTLALTGTVTGYLAWMIGAGALILGAALMLMRRRRDALSD